MKIRNITTKIAAFGLASAVALAPIAASAQFGKPVLPNPRENPEYSGGGVGNLRSGEGAPVLGQDRSGYSNKRMTTKRAKKSSTTAKRKGHSTETTGTVRAKPMNTDSNGTMNNSNMNSAPSSSMPTNGTGGSTGPAKAAPSGDNMAPKQP